MTQNDFLKIYKQTNAYKYFISILVENLYSDLRNNFSNKQIDYYDECIIIIDNHIVDEVIKNINRYLQRYDYKDLSYRIIDDKIEFELNDYKEFIN